MTTADVIQQSQHYLYPAEVPALKALVRSLRGTSVVVNVGAGFGTSGLAMIECRPQDLTLYTVDIEDGPSPTGSLETERLVMQQAGADVLLNKRWFQIHMDSAEAARRWPTLSPAHPFVDMVFIDAAHDYNSAYNDIHLWLNRIKAGGIIAIHDYGKRFVPPDPAGPTPDPFPGVDMAVNELLVDRYPVVLHIESLIAFRVQ